MRKIPQRSRARLLAGIAFYTLKKHIYWHCSRTDFAKKIAKPLPVEIFMHKTTLRRPLKNVDLWMQENKIVNLRLAIKKLDGLLLNPGQTFSYWRQIGKPTRRKGYVEGMVLHKGQIKSGLGGGLCQLSNLLYWMTLHTPLSVIERWRHSYDVFPDASRTQPFGSGATCAYPNIDLQIKNNTAQQFQLRLTLTDDHLVSSWLSEKPIPYRYEIIEKDHLIQGEWFGGYSRSNKIFRNIIDLKTGAKIAEEFVTANQAMMMYNPLLKS